MPSPIVQRSTLTQVNGGTASASLSGVTGGNTLLGLITYVDSGNNSSVPSGASDAQGAYTIDKQQYWNHLSATFFKLASATPGAHTLTASMASGAVGTDIYWGMQLWEIDATQYSASPDPNALAGNGNNSTGPVSASTGTLAKANSLLIGLATTNNLGTTGWQTASGWTLAQNNGGDYPGFIAEYIVTSSNAPQSPNFAPVLNPACNWAFAVTGYSALGGTNGSGFFLHELGVVSPLAWIIRRRQLRAIERRRGLK